MNYKEFLEQKRIEDKPTGLSEIPPLNPMLFDFQKDITTWALKRGRACIFADCGMGKTPMQLEWARHIPGRVLIVAPIAVASQTIQEADKFGIDNIEYLPECELIVGWAIWLRAAYEREEEWLASVGFVVLLWLPGIVALLAVRAYHEIILFYRRRTR